MGNRRFNSDNDHAAGNHNRLACACICLDASRDGKRV